MNTVLPVAVVLAYVTLLTYVALRARAAMHFEDFSLARRQLPLALIFGSLAATYVGPGFSISFVGRGFKTGALFLIVGLAYALQNILVGIFVAPKLRALKECHTLGEAFGQKYDRRCHIFAGMISVSICTFFAAVMAHAGAVLLNDMFGLPSWSGVMIVVGVTVLYTTFGGLRASVVTDAFQFAAFSVLLSLTLVLVLAFHLKTGAGGFTRELVDVTREGILSESPIKILGLLAAFLLGETLIPPYANRALASRTTETSRHAFVLAGCFSVVWFIVMIGLGIGARCVQVIPEGTEEDYVLLKLVEITLPTTGYALLSVVLVSVVMSSLDSLLNAGAVAFTADVVKPFGSISDDKALHVGRCATIVIGGVAAAATPFVPSIIEGLLICYTIWAAAILPALIFGLWLPRPQPLAALLSMSVGIFVAAIAVICLFAFPRAVETQVIIIPALGAALMAYGVGHIAARSFAGGKR